MSSKQQKQTGVLADKNVAETADPTVDDDNKSDSEYEYEYEEIEVEVDEEEEIVKEAEKVMISEVETIVPKEERKTQETLVLKSDGTTEKLVQKSKLSRTTIHQEKQNKPEKREKQESPEKPGSQDKQENQESIDKPRLGRTLTSQEESILLPLLQGLLAANGSEAVIKTKNEDTPSQKNDPSTTNKSSGSNSLAENTEKNFSASGSNILDELSTALNRLQTSLMEEKEVVTDTRKKNTILTLVAWLKQVLQTSTTDNAVSQLFSLSELLPTELLLNKLMPQLNNGNNGNSGESKRDDRTPASSKRFSRQRNNRFNTVGVSKEELADARLYLQKKLLSENLATNVTKSSNAVQHQTLLDEEVESRRKSLNLSLSNDLDKDIRSIFRESKNSFSKSIDMVPTPEQSNLKNAFPSPRTDQTNVFPVSTVSATKTTESEQTISQSKIEFRKKTLPSSNLRSSSRDLPTDSDDNDDPKTVQPTPSNGSTKTSNKSMNKFALRKLKMKRANTIDVPKEQLYDGNSDQGFSESFKDNNRHETANIICETVKSNCNNDVDKNHLPEFQVKSSGDKKFLAFLNKTTDESQTSWVNPHKTTLPIQQKTKANNWSNKFGNIKNSFEQYEQLAVSPKLSAKNNFSHAPTSPFKPVQSNKPPQIPNGVHHYQYNNQNVLNKVAAIQSYESNDKPQLVQNAVTKPQLRTYQSVPSSHPDDYNPIYRDPSAQQKPSNWQQNKYTSVDSYMQNSVSPKIASSTYNPLYVPKQTSNSPSSVPYTPPHLIQTEPKSLNSPSSNDFPSYTFTSTDYTQPACISTFGPENATIPVTQNTSPVIKNTILPDTSYLKSTSPPRVLPPLLGSSRLSKQMKTVDLYSSSEYLSEPNNYYRSPQPFSPSYDNYATNHDSARSSQEFMATSQIMKYPQSQIATVINKTRRYDDEQQALNLHAFLTNNVRNEKRQSEYSEKSNSPLSEPNFSHFNQTYVPPAETMRSKPNNGFKSMENISTTKFSTPDQGSPIRLRNNTSYYGSQNALTSSNASHEFINNQLTHIKSDQRSGDQSKSSGPVKLNSYGSQYIQPKVNANLDFSKPTYGKKVDATQNNIIKNNATNVNRSNTTTHQRLANYEIKRKQSLPAQNSDYFEAEHHQAVHDATSHNNSYLPFGALKKSKSTHTLALLQQFEAKGKNTEAAPLPSYIKKPSFDMAEPEFKPKIAPEIMPKPIIKKTPKVEETPKPAPIQQIAKPIQNKQPSIPIRPKTPPQSSPIAKKSPLESIRVQSHTKQLEAPSITETPSSPLVEDGHIIYPGQTLDTKRRVQHYAKTLNAMLNRKSIVIDDDDDEEDIATDKNDFSKVGLQRSKSGTLLAVPKQYESAIKKSEVLEKERTVAAYFAGNKSPQGLQRSSSQHSVHSSTSMKTVEGQKSNTVSPLQISESATHESSSRTTTTTKSAHHLKILRKQQKQSSPNPLAKSQTLPSINLLDESNVDDAFDNLFASFVGK